MEERKSDVEQNTLDTNDKASIRQVLNDYEKHLNSELQKSIIQFLENEIKNNEKIKKITKPGEAFKKYMITSDQAATNVTRLKKVYNAIKSDEAYEVVFKREKLNEWITPLEDFVKPIKDKKEAITNIRNSLDQPRDKISNVIQSEKSKLEIRRGDSLFWRLIDKLFGKTTMGVTGAKVAKKLQFFTETSKKKAKESLPDISTLDEYKKISKK